MALSPGTRRPVLVVLRALGLGDLLTCLPALRALADAYSAHRRILVAPAAFAPIAQWAGAIDEVADLDLKGGIRAEPLPANVRQADVAVNLHGRGPASTRLLLGTGPRRLVAYHCAAVPETAGGPVWRDDEHEVERWCRLVATAGATPDARRLDLDVPEGHAPEVAHGATLIHPGAASVARRWPAERWAAVARAEQDHGRRVIVTGSADEALLAGAVARRAGLPPDAVLAGRLDLAALAGAVSVAARVVCGDTGVAHLATAVGTPSVVLFGPSSPAHWGPPADQTRHRVLWTGTVGDPHGATCDPGLLRIGVREVLDALATLDRGHSGPEARAAEQVQGNASRW